MSQKNKRYKRAKDTIYPLPNRTVLYSRKKKLDPVPEVGKKYHCFDDGKITFSRHYIVKVSEVLGQMMFKRNYPELFRKYIEVTKDHYWLYSRSTDYFVICNKGENNKLGVYVRTKQGKWFGIGDWFNNNGLLDVTGKLWDNLVKHIDDFNYNEEEKVRLIEDNAI